MGMRVLALLVVTLSLGAVQSVLAQIPPVASTPSAAVAERGYLGATGDDREDRGRGVRIVKVMPGSAAEKAGLAVGDLVTGLGGVRVRQMADMQAILQDIAPGNVLTFEVLRGKEPKRIDVTFGRREASGKRPAAVPDRPVSVPPVTEPVPIPPPPPDKVAPPLDDHSRIEALERRIQELENRIKELERAKRG